MPDQNQRCPGLFDRYNGLWRVKVPDVTLQCSSKSLWTNSGKAMQPTSYPARGAIAKTKFFSVQRIHTTNPTPPLAPGQSVASSERQAGSPAVPKDTSPVPTSTAGSTVLVKLARTSTPPNDIFSPIPAPFTPDCGPRCSVFPKLLFWYVHI